MKQILKRGKIFCYRIHLKNARIHKIKEIYLLNKVLDFAWYHLWISTRITLSENPNLFKVWNLPFSTKHLETVFLDSKIKLLEE